VRLVFGDPYDYREKEAADGSGASVWEWHYSLAGMEKAGTDGVYDFWFIEIQPTWQRLRYAFYLEGEEQSYLFVEGKTLPVSGLEDLQLRNPMNFFAFPFINEVDVYRAPDWVKDTIWYQIFPERFANGDPENDPKDAKSWEELLESSKDHYGGDLQGVIDHLDYLAELGINGIYFTPIFRSNSNHKYDTIDYMTIDPHFGDSKVLKELVEEAHKRGIRVMLDVVFNHSGFYFDKFQDVILNGEKSAYKDWFHIKKYPVIDKAEDFQSLKELNFDTFAYTPSMPKLNTQNPETKEYLLNVIRYWSDIAPIDGWRLDVANEVDHQFWRAFRTVVREKNPQAYIVGEVWHDASPWLMGDQFDAVMNYPLQNAVVGFFAKDTIDSREFAHEVSRINFQYPKHVNRNMYNLLDSHDTPRFLNQTGENKDKLKLAYVFMMMHTGAPSIYYGDEVGMTGKQDPDCRRPMLWEEKDQDQELLAFMKKLIRIRKEHAVLRYKGDLCFLPSGNHPEVLLYKRYCGKEAYYILMNRSDKKCVLQLPEEMCNQRFYDLWQEMPINSAGCMELRPYGFTLLKLTSQNK
jgi:glycosidase